jgi:hypothetical protein
MVKSNNINNRCGNTRCPMRYTCALDIRDNPEFDIEGRCQMGWRAPKKPGEGKKHARRKARHTR